MRVCLLNDSFPPMIDGVANVVMNYARILGEMPDTRSMVGTPRYPDGSYDDYPYPVIPYNSINTGTLASGYRAGSPVDLAEIAKMVAFQPDIIHAHSPASATYVARSLRAATGAPIVYTYHTKYDIDIARAVKAEFMRKEAIKALVANIESCNEVWAVSAGAADNLRSLGFSGDIAIMENGVDFPRGRALPEAVAAATEGYDLPENVPVFLFVGRLMNYKGLPLIIDALAQLAAAGMDFRMVFVGAGDDKHKLVAQSEKAGLTPKIIFTGPIRDREVLRAWNTRADIFLFPSTFDTNGLVVREAAACGLASILIKGSCAAEGVTDGRNGFLIEENADSLAAKLTDLFGNDSRFHHDLCREVGGHAMDELYISWEQSVVKARERYAALLEKKAAGMLPEPKKDASDLLFGLTGQFADGIREANERRSRISQKTRYFYEGMLDNAAELRSAVEISAKEMRESLARSALRSRQALEESVQRSREDWEEAGIYVKESFAEVGDEISAAIEEAIEKLKR